MIHRQTHKHAHTCCNDDHLIEPDPKNHEQHRLLKIVLSIHFGMFLITAGGGWIAGSTVVLAESIDFLSHVFLLGLSLFAATQGRHWVARASLFKGVTMLAIGGSVLFDAAKRLGTGVSPVAEAIGIIGVLGILANLASMSLLKRLGTENLNAHSSYLCSRNDVMTHAGIILTSFLVALTGSRWPDTVIGCFLAVMILRSAAHVVKRSLKLLGEQHEISARPRTPKTRNWRLLHR